MQGPALLGRRAGGAAQPRGVGTARPQCAARFARPSPAPTRLATTTTTVAAAAPPSATPSPPPPPPSYDTIVSTASAELAATLAAVDPAQTAAAVDAIAGARCVVTAGVGREGLAMKGLAMRLFHAGVAASAVGEMTTPPVGPGDLLVLSAGPGFFSTVAALAETARAAGARTLVLTAQPLKGGGLRVPADVAVRIPARTMAEDHGSGGGGGGGGSSAEVSSVLPLGSAYELALQLWCDAAAALVTARLDADGRGGADLAARHTNLE
jgi:6-phospho-3-hexuloisomerase